MCELDMETFNLGAGLGPLHACSVKAYLPCGNWPAAHGCTNPKVNEGEVCLAAVQENKTDML